MSLKALLIAVTCSLMVVILANEKSFLEDDGCSLLQYRAKLRRRAGHPLHRSGLRNGTHALTLTSSDPLELDPLDSTDAAHTHVHNTNYIAILFFFGALVIGIFILMWLERRFPAVPYTCALFVAGALADLIHHVKAHDSYFTWPSWFDTVELWENIDPHTLFYAFLPALLFGEAMKLNVQMVHECFWQVFLLACPGVLFGTFGVACVARFLLPYGWDWPVALLFGSIVSATDPVAVVALFNTLGVSPRLTMLVSGESLLNDGTAIAMFSLMLKVAMGASLTSFDIVAFFGHMTLLSMALGFAISFVAILVIRMCAEEHYKHDVMVQVISTICTGYLSFFIAESEISTSGVITTVTAGFGIAYCAWPSFVNTHTMHTVWETIEFVGNTVVFFLAGLIFMDVVVDKHAKIYMSDWGWLLVLYVVLTLIRAVMIAVLWKPINAVGTPVSLEEAVVMVWSGLRGAVSLALALIVDLGPIGQTVGPHVVFHVGGIAALTFLVNASTASSLLRWLGLTKTKESRERIIAQFSSATTEGIQVSFEKSLSNERFVGAEPNVVRSMVPALRVVASGAQRGHDHAGANEDEILQAYRQALLRLVKYHYSEAIEKGLIPRNLDVSRILLQCTEKTESKTDQPLSDWNEIQAALDSRLPAGVLRRIRQVIESWPLRSFPELRRHFCADSFMVQKVYASLFYKEAHSHAQLQLPQYFDTRDAMSLRLQERVVAESKEQCDQAKSFLDVELQHQPEDYLALAKSEILARSLLQQQYESVSKMQEMGLFSDAEAEELLGDVNGALRDLHNKPKSEWMDRTPSDT